MPSGTTEPRLLASVIVLGLAALVRLPHYDVAWFGLDQVKYMFEARRILSGHWDVAGPDASGLDIIGPLYSFFMAGVLWLRDDPAFLVLFGVTCDVIASWFVFDVGRRLAGTAAGLAAAVTYVTMPLLVFGTRLVWNPTLLPMLVAIGWWLVCRYAESPSTARFVMVALVSGLALPLHATGVFHAAGLMLAAIAARPPAWRQLALGLVAGLLPLAPVIPRLFSAGSDVGALGARLAMPADLPALLKAIVGIPLNLPLVFGSHWSMRLSVTLLQVQATLAVAGALLGLTRGPFRVIWLGLAFSVAAQLIAASFYTSPVIWHHFIALSPAICLCIGRTTLAWPRWRAVAAALVMALAAAHMIFLQHADGEAIASGLIRVDTQYLAIRGVTGLGYSPTVREVRTIGIAARKIVPDGATGLAVAHGAAGELWRETAAQYVPAASAPTPEWTPEFVVMGRDPVPLRPDARVVDNRVCAFDRTSMPWRMHYGVLAPGWEQPQFVDAGWAAITLPRRVPVPSLTGADLPMPTWRTPQILLRGRFTAPTPPRRVAFGLVVRGVGFSGHWVTHASVNGVALSGIRDRTLQSSMAITHEWFIEVTSHLQPGENVIALAIDGQVPVFDLDVFEVPCLDADWYR